MPFLANYYMYILILVLSSSFQKINNFDHFIITLTFGLFIKKQFS